MTTEHAGTIQLPKPPRRPEIATRPLPEGFKPGKDAPVWKFRHNTMPVNWLMAGPVKGQHALEDVILKELGEGMSETPAGRSFSIARKKFSFDTISTELLKNGVLQRIDLLSLVKEKEEHPVTIALYAVLENDKARTVRIRLDRLGARMFIAGERFLDGQWTRLEKGRYPVLVVADTLQDYGYDPLFLAPRLAEFSETDIEALYALRKDLWSQGEKDAKTDVTSRLAELEFDPKTVRGAEGFFRVGKTVNGVWWFIDPDGKPFYYKGICGLNRAGTQGGRRAKPGPYAKTVDKKYDYQADPGDFVETTIQRLRGWGFNAGGSWTTEEFFEKGLPYTEITEFFHGIDRLEFAGPPDVFSNDWLAFVDKKAREICEPQKNNKTLVGYFLDNEKGYSTVESINRARASDEPVSNEAGPCLLQECLSEKPSTAAHHAAWDLVLERHGGNLQAVSEAWGVTLGSREDIRKLTEEKQALVSEGFAADADAFVVLFFETYLRRTCGAIRKYDPNHLIIGCRWAGPQHPMVMALERKHCDVRSFNTYRDMVYERVEEYLAAGEMPMMIGEFNYMDDSHMTIAMPFEAPGGYTPVERARIKGTIGFQHAFRHPCLVGYTWYRWVTGNERLSLRTYGMVNYDDEAVESNNRALALANVQAERIRLGAEQAGNTDCTGVTGNITLSLLWASASRKGPFTNTAKLVVGVHCKRGMASGEVVGHGIRGKVIDARAAHGSLHMTLEVELLPVVIPQGSGKGTYEVMLTRNSDHLAGTYTGTCNGIAVGNVASGWIG